MIIYHFHSHSSQRSPPRESRQLCNRTNSAAKTARCLNQSATPDHSHRTEKQKTVDQKETEKCQTIEDVVTEAICRNRPIHIANKIAEICGAGAFARDVVTVHPTAFAVFLTSRKWGAEGARCFNVWI